jgi:hypothetical protein
MLAGVQAAPLRDRWCSTGYIDGICCGRECQTAPAFMKLLDQVVVREPVASWAR